MMLEHVNACYIRVTVVRPSHNFSNIKSLPYHHGRTYKTFIDSDSATTGLY